MRPGVRSTSAGRGEETTTMTTGIRFTNVGGSRGGGGGRGGRGGGVGDSAGMELSGGSPLRESRQQSRDKAVLLRPISTPQRVAAGEVPLSSLEVILPDNREMYTEGEVTEWRLAHLAQMQALQDAFEERLQLCAEFWRGRYAVAVAAAADNSSKASGTTRGHSHSRAGVTSSGGGAHQPRSRPNTTQGGGGDQVKIQALPFVYPQSQIWPRKGGNMGYFEEITNGAGKDENEAPFGGGRSGSMRASSAPIDGSSAGGRGGGAGGGSARITGRGSGRHVSGKRHAVASPTTSPETGNLRSSVLSRHGGGFHANWVAAPPRANLPASARTLTAGHGTGHNFLGSRGGGPESGGGGGTMGPRSLRFGRTRPQTSGGV